MRAHPRYREIKTRSRLLCVAPLRCGYQLHSRPAVIVSSLVTSPEDGPLHVQPSPASSEPGAVIGRAGVGQAFTVLLTVSSETVHPLRVASVALTPMPGVEQLTPPEDLLRMIDGGRAGRGGGGRTPIP